MTLPRSLKLVLILILTFAAGGVGGSVLTAHLIRRAFEHSMQFEKWAPKAEADIATKLQLDDSQRAQLHVVIQDIEREFHTIFARTLRECGQVIVQSGRRIDAFLSPKQQEIHAGMKAELRHALKKSLHYELPNEEPPKQ